MTPEETAQYQQLMKQMATPIKRPQRATAASPFQDFANGFGDRQTTDDATLTANNAAAEKPLDADALKQQIIASHQSKGLGQNIMAGAQDLGTGLLSGIGGLAQFANTSEGQRAMAGLTGGNDLMSQQYLKQGADQKEREVGQDSAADESEKNRKKALMDVFQNQQKNELEDKRLGIESATAGSNIIKNQVDANNQRLGNIQAAMKQFHTTEDEATKYVDSQGKYKPRQVGLIEGAYNKVAGVGGSGDTASPFAGKGGSKTKVASLPSGFNPNKGL